MEKENEEGNIEYKLKVIHTDSKRLQELTTQMAYRLNEGSGECIYILGVNDTGDMIGIDDEDYKLSIENITNFAKANDSSIINISKKQIEDNKYIYELLIREQIENKYI